MRFGAVTSNGSVFGTRKVRRSPPPDKPSSPAGSPSAAARLVPAAPILSPASMKRAATTRPYWRSQATCRANCTGMVGRIRAVTSFRKIARHKNRLPTSEFALSGTPNCRLPWSAVWPTRDTRRSMSPTGKCKPPKKARTVVKSFTEFRVAKTFPSRAALAPRIPGASPLSPCSCDTARGNAPWLSSR
jgi:hypothetical protein